jgi:hypothetical protein
MKVKYYLKYVLKYIILITLIFNCNTNINKDDKIFREQVRLWYYSFSLANIHNNEDISARYANVIEKESIRTAVPSDIISRQNWVESRYKWYRSSKIKCKKTGKRIEYAVGPMGVVPKHWAHLLYTDDNYKLRDYLNNKKIMCSTWKKEDSFKYMNNLHIKYLKRIGYGIYAGAQIDRWNLDRFNQDYIVALTSYWAGPYSDELKDLIERHITNDYAKTVYYSNVFNEKMYSNEIKFEYDWKFPIPYEEMLDLYNKYHPIQQVP